MFLAGAQGKWPHEEEKEAYEAKNIDIFPWLRPKTKARMLQSPQWFLLTPFIEQLLWTSHTSEIRTDKQDLCLPAFYARGLLDHHQSLQSRVGQTWGGLAPHL